MQKSSTGGAQCAPPVEIGLKQPQVNKNVFDNEEVLTYGWHHVIRSVSRMAKDYVLFSLPVS